MTEPKGYDYGAAFKVNYGIFSRDEQERIRNARVAILGVGGAGGTTAIILARSGVANFVLIDPDGYEQSNTNRQIGCFVDTLGQYKAEVIQSEILRINPEAIVQPYTTELSFAEIEHLIDQTDVFVAAADDLAFSSRALLLAQQRRKFTITFMPTGLTGFVLVFPPDLSTIIDSADLFGAPKNLSYQELHDFLENPLNRCGRRWYVTQGKWRIDWFKKWRVSERPSLPLAQICPNVWLGTSLACIEVIKYLAGKWKPVRAPKMWHLLTAENRIEVERFRLRTWLFSKFATWAFQIKWMNIGTRYRSFALKRLLRELAETEQQEKEGKEVELPFMWRHVI